MITETGDREIGSLGATLMRDLPVGVNLFYFVYRKNSSTVDRDLYERKIFRPGVQRRGECGLCCVKLRYCCSGRSQTSMRGYDERCRRITPRLFVKFQHRRATLSA